MPRRPNPDRIIRKCFPAQLRLRKQRPDRTYRGAHRLPEWELWPWTCHHYTLGHCIAVAHQERWAPGGRDPREFMVLLPRATVLRIGYSWSRDGFVLCRLPEDPATVIGDGEVERPPEQRLSMFTLGDDASGRLREARPLGGASGRASHISSYRSGLSTSGLSRRRQATS
ncbi:hypothetical protein AB0I28_30565 [Phytomonospora sp. NPDC050363]|uniref:hypothetical protein n=1 Tax=Phytomonospora sp. NPDC050363 TaxID=3155642 RepID=UPI0033C26481